MKALVAAALLAISGLLVSDAYAYVDPGTGSLFIQAIIGAVVGAAIALKIYWYKFTGKLSGILKKDE